mgnify:CR=1 FL=1
MTEYTLFFAVAACVLLLFVLLLLLVLLRRSGGKTEQKVDALRADMLSQLRENREESSRSVQASVKTMSEMLLTAQTQANKANIDAMENTRKSVQDGMREIRSENTRQLEQMRATVDEKLQKTLDERMTQSFKLVNERLEQVYKGLGEMQTLAVGVGDLKKVLSNVKTRGTLGEIQLEAILSEILAPEQYEKNTTVSPHGRERVEFAIRLPAQDDSRVLLPIDSKFPTDAYGELVDAYEAGDPARIKGAQDSLVARIRGFARDIRDKYINPPYTTEFAIMFLPTEGLYAEAVRLGLVERLQRECQVNLAGPSTMAALLNSLQMGFRTVAIQKRSGEVWKVLGAVKTEFDRFHEVLTRAQKQLTRANNELDTLIGVRTRRIQSRLKDVTAMPAAQVPLYLPEDAVEIMDTDDEEKEE